MEDGLLSALPPPLHPTLGHAAGMPRLAMLVVGHQDHAGLQPSGMRQWQIRR